MTHAMTLSLKTIQQRLVGSVLHNAPVVDVAIAGFDIDSRRLLVGQLFVAIRGPNFDGHDFAGRAGQAEKSGAVALVVDTPVDSDLPQIVVEDTRLALGRLGQIWRDEWVAAGGKIVALTGSNGKTSTKEMLAAILNQVAQTTATVGNLNNDFGVPLTLGRLQTEDQFAVVEMGANHAGEIEYLTNLVRPHVGLITNAGAAHLEGFGSLDGVAKAKGEIYLGLSHDAVAIVNGNDVYADDWHAMIGDRASITFGLVNEVSAKASESLGVRVLRDGITVDAASTSTTFTLQLGDESVVIKLPRFGEHNIMNALAASAAASALGASLEHIQAGLEAVPPVAGRLAMQDGPYNSHIIDDSYNANPASVKAGIDVLVSLVGDAWVVFGDMSEIGADSQQAHANVGSQARTAGAQRLWACGEQSQATADAFGAGAQHFTNREALAENLFKALQAKPNQSINILVKGSRSSGMEAVINELQRLDGVEQLQQEPTKKGSSAC